MDDMYQYALAAHFDVLVSKNNKAFLAIEFDGARYDPRGMKIRRPQSVTTSE